MRSRFYLPPPGSQELAELAPPAGTGCAPRWQRLAAGRGCSAARWEDSDAAGSSREVTRHTGDSGEAACTPLLPGRPTSFARQALQRSSELRHGEGGSSPSCWHPRQRRRCPTPSTEI